MAPGGTGRTRGRFGVLREGGQPGQVSVDRPGGEQPWDGPAVDVDAAVAEARRAGQGGGAQGGWRGTEKE